MKETKAQRRRKSILDCLSVGAQQGTLLNGHCKVCSDSGICWKIIKLLNEEIK